MKFSVIIPVFNRTAYLQQAIDSVWQQGADSEIILVNDGSDAVTSQTLLAFSGQPNVHLIHSSVNKGVSHARNLGVASATGDLVIFLDDDDYLEPDIFSEVRDLFRQHSDISVIIGKSRLVTDVADERFQRLNAYHQFLQEIYQHAEADRRALFLIQMPAIHSMVFRRSLLSGFSFRADLSYGEDRFLLLEMKNKGVVPFFFQRQMACYRIHQRSAVPLSAKLYFVQQLKSTNLLNSWFERRYADFLKGYFLWQSHRRFSAILPLISSMTSVGVLRHLLKIMNHLRKVSV